MASFKEMVNAEISRALLAAKERGDLPENVDVHVVKSPIFDRPIKVKEAHDFGAGPERVEVEAYAIGDKGVFAIAPQGNPAFMMWKVTHIPSGRVVMVSIDPVKDASALESFDVDWSKERPDGPDLSKSAAYARANTPNRGLKASSAADTETVTSDKPTPGNPHES